MVKQPFTGLHNFKPEKSMTRGVAIPRQHRSYTAPIPCFDLVLIWFCFDVLRKKAFFAKEGKRKPDGKQWKRLQVIRRKLPEVSKILRLSRLKYKRINFTSTRKGGDTIRYDNDENHNPRKAGVVVSKKVMYFPIS